MPTFIDAPLPYDNNSDVPSPTSANEKIVRRRSSKACDQCRKAKCKCERSGLDGESCKSCVLLGTECTFLGPSRKRGPAKGYLSDLELKLHQLEALVGSIIGASPTDARARSLIADISQDDIAREILQRVEISPFGPKGRKMFSGTDDEGGSEASFGLPRQPGSRRVDRKPLQSFPGATPEWQDYLIEHITASGMVSRPPSAQRMASQSHHPLRYQGPSNNSPGSGGANHTRSASHPMPLSTRDHPHQAATSGGRLFPTAPLQLVPLEVANNFHFGGGSGDQNQNGSVSSSESPRQRRRIDHTPSPLSRPGGVGRLVQLPPLTAATGEWSASSGAPETGGPQASFSNASALWSTASSGSHHGSGRTSPHVSQLDPLETDDLADDLGQLSMNEDHQVRYHGKSSGLYILGHSARLDDRNRDGLWQFPPARVWPLAPDRVSKTEKDIHVTLPSAEQQAKLLDLYFVHVHPILPIVPRKEFLAEFRGESSETGPEFSSSAGGSYTSHQPQCRVPSLLLLAMFALGARYSEKETPHPPKGHMWTAGDSYFEDAKLILNHTYASSRRSTCQALLLLSYREIGIGAMAQAWIYTGMAVRMAQDLGLHRSIDKWHPAGSVKFTEAEKEVRKRTWWACVLMDKYVSTYIGRPLSIFERDYDTPLPAELDEGEGEIWDLWKSIREPQSDYVTKKLPQGAYTPVSGRIMMCFRAAAQLASHVGHIVETLYSLRHPTTLRQRDAAQQLEERLDKWLFDLPEPLRFDPSAKKPVPPPSVLTLHMQYWSATLLLHRPFIRYKQDLTKSPGTPPDDQATLRSARAFDVCTFAATQIANIATSYRETFSMSRCPAFLSYYVFSAGITHIGTLTERKDELQAIIGLRKCTDFLKEMEVVWPSAGRAWELLHGSKVDLHEAELARLSFPSDRHKRGADEAALNGNGWTGNRRESNQQYAEQQRSHRATPVQQYQKPYSSYSMPAIKTAPNTTFFTPEFNNQWPSSGRSHMAPSSTFPSTSVRTPLEPSPSESNSLSQQPQYIAAPQQQHFVADPQDASEGQMAYWGEYTPADPFSDPTLLTSSYYGLPSTIGSFNANVPAPPQSAIYAMHEYPPIYNQAPPNTGY